jgi:hypothetical protein
LKDDEKRKRRGGLRVAREGSSIEALGTSFESTFRKSMIRDKRMLESQFYITSLIFSTVFLRIIATAIW